MNAVSVIMMVIVGLCFIMLCVAGVAGFRLWHYQREGRKLDQEVNRLNAMLDELQRREATTNPPNYKEPL